MKTIMKIYGVLLFIGVCKGQFLKLFEFENTIGGPGHSRTPWRSEASDFSALHVFKGDKVDVQLCLSETVTFYISSLKYSNDGPADNVSIKLDGVHYITFETKGNDGDFGNLWNVFLSETKIGEPRTLDKGVHTLEFTFEESDCYGTELDNIELSVHVDVNKTDLFCDSSFIQAPEAIRTPCAVEWDAPKPPPPNQVTESTKVTSSIAKISPVSTFSSTVPSSSHAPTTLTHPTQATAAPTTVTANPVSSSSPTLTSLTHPTVPKTVTFSKSSSSSTPSATTQPTKPTTTIMPNSISQLSFESKCIDEANVHIDIHPASLKNTLIIARPSTAAAGKQATGNVHAGFNCDADIWHIGQADGSNKELDGVIQTGTIDFDVNIKNNGTEFPGEIDFVATNDVFLNYIIPKRFNIKKGRVRFVLGLAGLTKELSIGLKYYDRAKKNAPEVDYKTFSPSQPTVEWVIPARAVSPSLQNVIHIIPDHDGRFPVMIDFMKLKYFPKSNITPMKLLKNVRPWKIRGKAYKVKKKASAIPDGMSVEIDNMPLNGVFSEVDIIRKPNIKILAVTESGEVFLSHKDKPGRIWGNDRDRMNKNNDSVNRRWKRQNEEVSAFTFGSTDALIDKVSISTQTSEVTLTYDNGNFVKFTYDYSREISTLTIFDTSFTSGPLSFVSTYLSHDLAGVNGVSIDGGKSLPIMSPSLNGLIGNRFKFLKTSGSSVFGNNDDLEVVLPVQS